MAASTVGWPVGRIYTHTSAQCSPASVGLAQARPNYSLSEIRITQLFWSQGCLYLRGSTVSGNWCVLNNIPGATIMDMSYKECSRMKSWRVHRTFKVSL